jgi:hypothetical protein
MMHEPGIETTKPFTLFRPREIKTDSIKLRDEVGLFGTCGTPASTWREDIFIPALQRRGLKFYNPQLGPNEWKPEMASIEADHLANDEVIVFPISKETHGYGSLGEAGWAILGALMRGQKLGIYIEEDESMPKPAKRARALFKALATQLQKDYPVFQFEDSLEDQAIWAAISMRERAAMKHSKIRDIRTLKFPKKAETQPCISILGTSVADSAWKNKLKENYEKANVQYFDPYRENWTDTVGAEGEVEHKTKDKVILQIITGETESFGSIAESGLLALSAFVRGQAYGIYIEDHPSEPTSETNRARTLIRAHIKKLNEQFPGIIFLADSIDELQEWSIKAIKK